MLGIEQSERFLQEDDIKYALSRATRVARTLACSLVVLVHINLYIRPGMGSWWPGGFFLSPSLVFPFLYFLSSLAFLQAVTQKKSVGPAYFSFS